MSKKIHKIAVIPGDGIGKEVMPEGERVLAATAKRFGLNLALTGGVSSAAINAMALLGTEPEGLALDFTADDGQSGESFEYPAENELGE